MEYHNNLCFFYVAASFVKLIILEFTENIFTKTLSFGTKRVEKHSITFEAVGKDSVITLEAKGVCYIIFSFFLLSM